MTVMMRTRYPHINGSLGGKSRVEFLASMIPKHSNGFLMQFEVNSIHNNKLQVPPTYEMVAIHFGHKKIVERRLVGQRKSLTRRFDGGRVDLVEVGL